MCPPPHPIMATALAECLIVSCSLAGCLNDYQKKLHRVYFKKNLELPILGMLRSIACLIEGSKGV